MATKMGPQDMPPAGGYSAINFERTKLRTILTLKKGMLAFAVSFGVGWALYMQQNREIKRQMFELRSAKFALQPLMLAERERMMLKQIRKNRDIEGELMKDYPGWQVGKYFDEPVYVGDAPDTFHIPSWNEYNLHADRNDALRLRVQQRLYV